MGIVWGETVNDMVPTTMDTWIATGFLILAAIFAVIGLAVWGLARKRNIARLEEVERKISEWDV